MIAIGIDPGLDGGVAVIWENSDVHMWPTPTLNIVKNGKARRDYNGPGMASILRKIYNSNLGLLAKVAIEQVHAMPKQGVTSAFTFGMGYGTWLGIIDAFGMSLDRVEPARWKKSIMDGMGREKEAAILRAQQLFPNHAYLLEAKRGESTKKEVEGMAEALLIAEYRRRLG